MKIYHKSTNTKVGNGDNKTFPYFIFPTLMWACWEKIAVVLYCSNKKKIKNEKRKKNIHIYVYNRAPCI